MESFLRIHIVELFWNYFVNYHNSQNNSKIIYRVNYEFLPSVRSNGSLSIRNNSINDY